jgi:mRNA interferase RelE/StbE
MYKIIFDEKAIEYLEKIPKLIAKRIFRKIQNSKENPHRYFIKLTNRPEYKLRVGDYRVIADINNDKLTILIVLIDHRKKVYNKLGFAKHL